ncbi:MAG: Hint domain-containing protein, partial [Paracoccus sp. (in: a-proteobacteria)]
MPVIQNNVSVQNYNGSILSLNLLSGNNQNLILNSLGPVSNTTVTDNNNHLVPGETVTLGNGTTATVLGSGTAQPGISVGFITVPTGTQVPLVILQQGSQIIFLYPEGTPNILGAVALVVNASETPYTFPGGVLCFTAETLIETGKGLLPAAQIRAGMSVLTRDAGLQEVAWAGSHHLTRAELERRKNLRPILIREGSLGDGVPSRDMVVSPQHRILVGSKIIARMFDEPEALVAAKHLTELEGVEAAPWNDGVTYTHFMFEQHQVVQAEGAYSESLFTGPEALKAVSEESRQEILRIFPALQSGSGDNVVAFPQPARKLLTGRQGRALA